MSSSKPDRDRSLEVEGFLNELQGWNNLFKDKNQKLKTQYRECYYSYGYSESNLLLFSLKGSLQNSGKSQEEKGPPKKVPAVESNTKSNVASDFPAKNPNERYNYSKYSAFLNEETLPDATSEKELGNEYFKQKKFAEAIDCYSRSIALSPTSVAFANRAMAYLKLRRLEEAENDCTEALNLDDRYVKAYSRRATARKELGKLKQSMEDSEFAIRLEPNNQELKKQYAETKALYDQEMAKKVSQSLKPSVSEIQKADNLATYKAQKTAATAKKTVNMNSSMEIDDSPLVAVNDTEREASKAPAETRENLFDRSKGGGSSSADASMKGTRVSSRKDELKPSMQDLASRASSLALANSSKSITAPKSAYEFEVSWRALSDDCGQQAQLLKAIPPSTLPQIFKNALSAPILIDIIKCTATFFREDTEFAVSILDNLVKVPRFDMIVMCLSAKQRSAELRRIWEEVFSIKDIAARQIEAINRLRLKYCGEES
ncbi:RNA polymerase II-associated protein 3 isoform X1 [Ananas comosus]|uniref:RNA polymerase II-associated protein 3 isoform X1 n=1 Tax=Ananas comosus TaxID=4615 RepID=A0A6P5EZE2_ANACO|nr:RNA polymerase II-associated protein 3 isoform X1 [Ananas comosus]